MSDFRKLQNLVNEYYGQYSDFPGGKYTPNQSGTDNGKKNTYRRPLPTTSPDKPAYVQASMATSPIESEEGALISKEKVLGMVNQELKQAADEGMDYCVLVLLKLQKFISQA